MTFKEFLDTDIAQYEKDHHTSSSNHVRDERVKTGVEFRRSQLIGEIMIRHFPELERFQPQLHQDANEKEFKPFEDFLIQFAKYVPVKKAFSKMIAEKRAEDEMDESKANL